MGENSSIEWCHHTFNAWWGCEKISEACKHCYAEMIARRFAPGHWGKHAPRKMASERTLAEPHKWNERARRRGRRERVFVNSMSDVGELLPDDHPQRQDVEAALAHLWRLVEQTPYLDWLLLTKRPANLLRLPPFAGSTPLFRNLWVGVTVETQQRADERLGILAHLPATVRYVSYEPAIEAVDLRRWVGQGIDWVIAGGESGQHARPSSPAWFESMRAQCEEAAVPFFFKQWGAWCPDTAVNGATRKLARDSRVIDGVRMVKVGAKRAGARLEHGAFRELPKQARLFAA